MHYKFKTRGARGFAYGPPPFAMFGGGHGCVCMVEGHHEDEDELEDLEEYQRDLEQELANVADRIKKMEERAPAS